MTPEPPRQQPIPTGNTDIAIEGVIRGQVDTTPTVLEANCNQEPMSGHYAVTAADAGFPAGMWPRKLKLQSKQVSTYLTTYLLHDFTKNRAVFVKENARGRFGKEFASVLIVYANQIV